MSAWPDSRDGFRQLLRAEWTKLRTVGRWWLTLLAAVLVTVLVSLFSASSAKVETKGGGPPPPVGPDGHLIRDSFSFVHRTLDGDGSITARVSGPAGDGPARAPGWAKAGVLVRQSTREGSAYAALMMTAGHGVRLQSAFVRDVAGSATPAGTARWLRLTREGGKVTGYESADGVTWDEVGVVELDGAAGAVPVGLFVASPEDQSVRREFGNVSVNAEPSRSTARFDHVSLTGAATGDWELTNVGTPPGGKGELVRTEDGFTLTGSGDIGPAPVDTDLAVMALSGSQLGLILLAALGTLFITSEYRRGMILTTFAASPRRGRVLVAKAVVLGATTFAAGLVAAVVSFAVGMPVLRDNGHRPPVFPHLGLGDGPALRAVVGTAVVLSLISVLALGLGALLRRTATAVVTVVVVFVVPLILFSALPLGLSRWLQRLTPVAGFAIQGTVPRHEQVESPCLPDSGCYPQSPWAGLATLAGYAAVVLAVAVWRIRKRDA